MRKFYTDVENTRRMTPHLFKSKALFKTCSKNKILGDFPT